MVTENNWLGEGKQVAVDVELSEESPKGQFTYTDPNYDLLGNSISYNLRNTTNDKPDQGYENSVFELGASTGFEQFSDLFANLAINLSYDDLRTTSNASSSLKNKVEFLEFAGSYGFAYDKRNEVLCQLVDRLCLSINLYLSMLISLLLITHFELVFTIRSVRIM